MDNPFDFGEDIIWGLDDEDDDDTLLMQIGLAPQINGSGAADAHVEMLIYQGGDTMSCIDLGTADELTDFLYSLMRCQNLARELDDMIEGITDITALEVIFDEFQSSHEIPE